MDVTLRTFRSSLVSKELETVETDNSWKPVDAPTKQFLFIKQVSDLFSEGILRLGREEAALQHLCIKEQSEFQVFATLLLIFARCAALGECFFCQAEPILLSGEAKPRWLITKKRTSKTHIIVRCACKMLVRLLLRERAQSTPASNVCASAAKRLCTGICKVLLGFSSGSKSGCNNIDQCPKSFV